MLDPELLQDIVIQIRLDRPGPNDRMGYQDYQAAKAIEAFADAIEKIAARKMEESLKKVPPAAGTTIKIDNNRAICPFCDKAFIGTPEGTQPEAVSTAFRLHLYDEHPRKFQRALHPQQLTTQTKEKQ